MADGAPGVPLDLSRALITHPWWMVATVCGGVTARTQKPTIDEPLRTQDSDSMSRTIGLTNVP